VAEAADPIFALPGDGDTVRNPAGGPLTFKLRGARTGGSMTVFESVAAAGEGPPLHTHAEQDELLYFLDGKFRVKCGGQVREAPVGSTLFIPRGAPHTWQNVGKSASRFLVVFAPAAPGMETFFDRAAETPSGDIAEVFAELGPAAGMEVLGPPLAESDPLT
jgi:quercetin dioxygenase-like cupin family protein